MKIIISPAKKMREDIDSLPIQGLPQFLEYTEEILERMRSMSYEELRKLWGCSDQLTELNMRRLQTMDLRKAQTPAIFAYEGIQYQHMSPRVCTQRELDYLQEHLRILSGFYGVLCPFDAVTPYRLEMQAKLETGKVKNLYNYWEQKIYDAVADGEDCILNLASKEYSICVSKHLQPEIQFVTCVFAERKGEKLIEKGTMCKMARGEMVRFLAAQQITKVEDIKYFTELRYRFSPKDSTEETYVFLKE